MERLFGKVAVITGGNAGIGRATAKLFAAEGAKVAIVDLKSDPSFGMTAEEINREGGEAISIPGDVTSVEDCKNAFEQAVAQFGKIDILVNNAGVSDYFCQTLKVTDAYWDRLVAINQTGVFYCCREALKYFVKQKYGTIVNVSAIAGIQGNAGLPYSATKHAVIGITKNIAIQYAGTDIRCNAVCPGATLTNMMNEDVLMNKVDREMWDIVAKHQCNDTDVPVMDPIHQAKVILFLASDDSYAITGQAIISDRGKFM